MSSGAEVRRGEEAVIESTIEFRVRYAESDQMGVVYHANYLVWCEMGRTDHLRRLGHSYAEMERQGVYLAVSTVRIRFRAPARYDDRVRVRTRLTRLRSRAVTFDYRIENAETGVVLADAEIDLICTDREGATRKLPVELQGVLHGARDAGFREGTIDAPSGV